MESIKRILARRSIAPSVAVRFGAFFGQSEDFWHGIQVECDFRALAKDKRNSPRTSNRQLSLPKPADR